IAQGDLAGGAALLDKAVAADPKLLDAWLLLSTVRERLGDRVAARAALDQALAASPDDAAAHLARAELLMYTDEAQAAADLAVVLRETQDDPLANLLDA